MNTQGISIHAPREGGDFTCFSNHAPGMDFNPRPPRGGRLRVQIVVYAQRNISIHAPREGGDAHRA